MSPKDLEILYEDNHIIVVVKPENILSQSDATKDPDMLTLVKKYVKEKYNKPGEVYIGLIHRLDRPVGGLMVFARTSKAASRLSDDVKNHKIIKKYLAIVHGSTKEEDNLIDYIKKEENGNSVITNEETGKLSKLTYKTLSFKDDLSLVDINLETGRHHQIRVQFASRNYPLYGDQRYGIQDKKQLALYAYYLEFVHPVKKELMIFKKYPQIKDIWSLFKDVIS